MLRASHSLLLRPDRVVCSIQEQATAPRRQRAALRRAPRGGLRLCAVLREALGYGWAPCIKKSWYYLLAFSQCVAAHGESHIRTSDAVAAAPMQNITTMVPYRERSPRAPPNNQTWATGMRPLTQQYSDRSRRYLSENATGNSHSTCRSRVIFHTHIPIAWQGNKSPHLPSGGICSLVLAKSRTRRSGEKLIEHSDDHGKEHVAGHPLGSDRIQIHARYCTAPS